MKIGLGIVTYNAPDKIVESASTVPREAIDCFVIVNDGSPYLPSVYPRGAEIVNHETNESVGKAKNTALKWMMQRGCDHLFLMEDDIIIRSPDVFSKYIEASRISGIGHFNFGLQGPANMRLPTMDRLRRHLAISFAKRRQFDEGRARPAPRALVVYPGGLRLVMYPNCVGAFTYMHRSVVESVGYHDEVFRNAMEHVEHTYRIILAGLHPPFGWFVDLERSDLLLGNISSCIERSTIAKDFEWESKFRSAVKHFQAKHGDLPSNIQKRGSRAYDEALKCINRLYELQSQNHGQVGHPVFTRL